MGSPERVCQVTEERGGGHKSDRPIDSPHTFHAEIASFASPTKIHTVMLSSTLLPCSFLFGYFQGFGFDDGSESKTVAKEKQAGRHHKQRDEAAVPAGGKRKWRYCSVWI